MSIEENFITFSDVTCDCENLFKVLYNSDISNVTVYEDIPLTDSNSKVRMSLDDSQKYFDILKNDRLVICDGEIQEFLYSYKDKSFLFEYNGLVLSLTLEEMRLLNPDVIEKLGV